MTQSTPILAAAPTMEDALNVLMGFVSSHADKGDAAAIGMVKFANLALVAGAERVANLSIPTVVIGLHGGLIGTVESSHPMKIYVKDGDTEGGARSRIADVGGVDFFLSNESVSAEDAKGDSDADFNAAVEQIELHFHSVPARLEWLWPDQESNSTAVTVDLRTGVVTILDRSELDADYDDVSVIQRVIFKEFENSFDVEPFGDDGWRIMPQLLDDFVAEAETQDEAEED